MKKNLIILFLFINCLAVSVLAQGAAQSQYRKISQMISDSEKINNTFAGMLGMGGMPDNSESTILGAINFPNSVKVKYMGESRKIGKQRKKAVDKWLKEYANNSGAKNFYVNEIAVEEDGTTYWIMSHEKDVIARLKSSVKAGDEIVLKMKILGYYKKGKTIDHFLLADGLI